MKIRKTSFFAVFAAIILVAGISSVFITSAAEPSGGMKLNTRLLSYLDMPYGQFREQVGTEAEFYHGLYFLAPIPEENANLVFRGIYDEEIAGTVLSDEDTAFRVESRLDRVISGVGAEMTPTEFQEALASRAGFVHEVYRAVQEGLTAYYVAYHYLDMRIDSDGDGTLDLWLSVALDETDHVTPDASVWLHE